MPEAAASPSVDPGIYMVVIIQFIIGIFGTVLNTFVLYVTIKYKQFRKLTNYLLCLICFYDALFGFAGIIPFITMTAQWPIPLMPCYFLAMPSIFPLANTIDLMFVLGVERLVSVLFPIWYHAKANDMKNVPLMIFVICFAKNSYLFYFCFQNASMTPDRLVFCLPSDVFLGFVQALSANLGLVANISTMILYAILWITIKIRHNANTATSATAAGVNHQNQINRSLFVLMIIYLSCWFPSILANIIIPNLALDARTIVLTNRMILQLNRVATALNAPILYFCSSEYRSAFRKELGRFLGRGNKQQQSNLMTNTIAHRIHPLYPTETHHHHQWQGQQRRQPMTMAIIN